MSRMSRPPSFGIGSAGKQRRRKAHFQQRHNRHHFLQQLERRDHPGSFLDIGLITLLGDEQVGANPIAALLAATKRAKPDGVPIDQLLGDSAAFDGNVASWQPLLDSFNSPLSHPAQSAGRAQPAIDRLETALPSQSSRLNAASFNPLTASVSESSVNAAFSGDQLSPTNLATGSTIVNPELAPRPGGGSAAIAGTGSHAPALQSTDTHGHSMPSSRIPSIPGGNHSVPPADATGPDENSGAIGASTHTTQTDTTGANPALDPPPTGPLEADDGVVPIDVPAVINTMVGPVRPDQTNNPTVRKPGENFSGRIDLTDRIARVGQDKYEIKAVASANKFDSKAVSRRLKTSPGGRTTELSAIN